MFTFSPPVVTIDARSRAGESSAQFTRRLRRDLLDVPPRAHVRLRVADDDGLWSAVLLASAVPEGAVVQLNGTPQACRAWRDALASAGARS